MLLLGAPQAQPQTPPAQPRPNPCDAAEYRHFDFWLGDWAVRTPDGKLCGHNRISSIVGGRGLREEWQGAGGVTGTSLNIWSAERNAWHQTWIDSTGGLLLLDGGLRDGEMVMEGDGVGDEGRPIRHRITWAKVEGDVDRLRQHWETSADGGQTWETAFDGHYTRAARTED